MASHHQLLTLLSVLLLSSAIASTSGHTENHNKVVKKSQVVVEGMVYCQSCKKAGSWSLTDAKPIPGAKVSVICKDHKNRVSYYKVFSTNGGGYFYAELDGFKLEHYLLDHPLHSCVVRLVASPLSYCNTPTNINYGMDGAALRYKNVNNNKRLVRDNFEAVVYSAGPLVYRPSYCH